jgi:Mitochondrial carrier protein
MVCGATSSVPIVAKQILENEGPWGFWRGNALNLLRTVPFKSINFCAFDLYRYSHLFSYGHRNLSKLLTLLTLSFYSSLSFTQNTIILIFNARLHSNFFHTDSIICNIAIYRYGREWYPWEDNAVEM